MNDAGTVAEQIDAAYEVGGTLTDNLQVIAVHGGASTDNTFDEIKRMKTVYPSLFIVDKTDNWERYAVIKYGFAACTNEWIFYTDGDAQYSLNELPLLVKKQIETNADVVNGYKKKRGDGFVRALLGNAYAKLSTFIFELPIRDTDCDFRLIKKTVMDKITLESHDSSILAEMLKKLELVKAKFAEIPVSHFDRKYGTSNYKPLDLFKEKLFGDLTLYKKMRKIKGGVNSLRIVKFGSIGVTSIVIQVVLFNLLMILFRITPGVATILSDQLAIVTSFILNDRITFQERRHVIPSKAVLAFIKFWSIVIVATLAQAGIVFLGTYIFGRGLIFANFFFIIGVAVTFFWNYKTQKRFVWNI